ncbi:hypothetical protein AURDEDRAFT_155257 [Auricularia subglabra TFB-10046 SS5]|nr:hypothetical protein AURDEDRAFT_155257 [Auricularia subglabra TFB-10046 SS5]
MSRLEEISPLNDARSLEPRPSAATTSTSLTAFESTYTTSRNNPAMNLLSPLTNPAALFLRRRIQLGTLAECMGRRLLLQPRGGHSGVDVEARKGIKRLEAALNP